MHKTREPTVIRAAEKRLFSYQNLRKEKKR